MDTLDALLVAALPVLASGGLYLRAQIAQVRSLVTEYLTKPMPEHGHRALEDRLSVVEDTLFHELDALDEAEQKFAAAVASAPARAGHFLTANRDFVYGPEPTDVCRRGVQYPTSHPGVLKHPAYFTH